MEEKQQDQPMGPNSSGGSRVKTRVKWVQGMGKEELEIPVKGNK